MRYKNLILGIALFCLLSLPVSAVCSDGSCSGSATTGSSVGNATCNVAIKSVTITGNLKVLPAKVGITTLVTGNVIRTKTVITDSNKKIVASCSSFCPNCVKNHKCICSVIIKKPGTYTATVSACCANGKCVTATKTFTVGTIKTVATATKKTSGTTCTTCK